MVERSAQVPYSGDIPTTSGAVAENGSGAQPLSVRATPDSFGAQVGGAVSDLGGTAEKLANHYAEMAVHTNVNDQYVNGYAPQVNAIVSDYKKLSGTDAIQQLPVYQQKVQDLNQQYLGKGGGLQQELMGGLVQRHTLYTLNDLSNHADREFSQHEQDVQVQSMKNASDEAANNWNQPDVVDFNVNRAMGLSKINYARKIGYDPESQGVADQTAKEDASHVVTSAITMAIDNRDPQTANYYKNKYSDILSGKDKLSVEKYVSSLTVDNNADNMADNLLKGAPLVQPGTQQHQTLQTKADIAELATKNNFDPNIAFALHGAESDYGKNIPANSRLKDDFQTDPKYRDAGFTDDSLESSMHNAAKIWNANSSDLAKRLGTTPSVSQNYLAYNQGGAGAHALLTAGPNDTAIDALSTIMPPDEAKKHVLQNGGTPTQSAADFSNHIEQLFQNHYDTQKVTASGNPAQAIRQQTNIQIPAVQQANNPHDLFKQIEASMPAASAAADAVPDDKLRDALQKKITAKYQIAKRDNDAWKNQQADVVNQYAEDPRYTTLDQVPTTVKNTLRDAGQLGALERQLNDKLNPKKDNTFGTQGFMQVMGRMVSDDKTDAIGDMAGLQQAYADTPDLHTSGFKQLQGMIKNLDTPAGKATAANQYQFLTALQQKMVAGANDVQGKKDFEAALPQFFSQYNSATTQGKDIGSLLSFDPNNKNAFINTVKVPSAAELTNRKIQNTTSWLDSFFKGQGSKAAATSPVNYTPQEQVMADFTEGRITNEEKNQRLKNLGVTPSPVPRPE